MLHVAIKIMLRVYFQKFNKSFSFLFIDIKKQFILSPSPTSVEEGSPASLRCSPPAAVPPPRVTWLKNGLPLQQDHNVLISAEGNLLVTRATLQVILFYIFGTVTIFYIIAIK